MSLCFGTKSFENYQYIIPRGQLKCKPLVPSVSCKPCSSIWEHFIRMSINELSVSANFASWLPEQTSCPPRTYFKVEWEYARTQHSPNSWYDQTPTWVLSQCLLLRWDEFSYIFKIDLWSWVLITLPTKVVLRNDTELTVPKHIWRY